MPPIISLISWSQARSRVGHRGGDHMLGLLTPLEALLRPVIEFLRPVPSVALIPRWS